MKMLIPSVCRTVSSNGRRVPIAARALRTLGKGTSKVLVSDASTYASTKLLNVSSPEA